MKYNYLLVAVLCVALCANSQTVQRIPFSSPVLSENTGQNFLPWLNDNTDSLVENVWTGNFKWIDVKLPLQSRSLISKLSFFDDAGVFTDKPAYLYAVQGNDRVYLGKFEGLTYKNWVDLTVTRPVLADTIIVHKYSNNIPQKVKVFGTPYQPGVTVFLEEKLVMDTATWTVETGQHFNRWYTDNMDSLVEWGYGDRWSDVTLKLHQRSKINRLSFWDMENVFTSAPAEFYALKDTVKTFLGVFTGEAYATWVNLKLATPVMADAILVHKFGGYIPKKIWTYGIPLLTDPLDTLVAPEGRLPITAISPITANGMDFSPWLSDNLDSLVQFSWGQGNYQQYTSITLELQQKSKIGRLMLYDDQGSFPDAPAYLYGVNGTDTVLLHTFTGDTYQNFVEVRLTDSVTASKVVVRKIGNNIPQKIKLYGRQLSATTPAPVTTPAVDTGAIVKIPIDPKRWYILNNVIDVVGKFFDSSTSNVYGGYGRIIDNYEAYYPVKAGEKIDLTSIKMYDGSGTLDTAKPFTLSIIDTTGQRRQIATFNGSQYNAWVGPYPNRQTSTADKFKLDSTVRNVRYLVLNMRSGYPCEIEFYGRYKASAPATAGLAKTVKFKEELGINAFEWDFESPYDPMKIDSASYAGVKNFTGVRHYMDWEKLEGQEGSYTYSPVHSGGWNYDTIYQQCKKDGITVLACLKTVPSWLQATYPQSDRDAELVPVPYGSDFSKPQSYLKQAKTGFQYIARYGNNPNVDRSLLSVNTTPRWNHDAINQVKVGMGVIKYIECDNERDKWWKGRKGYQTSYEYAANLSAFYDGHKNTMGPGVGVKNADSTVKVVMGGLAAPDPAYVRGMIEWCKLNRGYKPDGTVNLCWDIINYHLYSNNAQSSQNGNSTRGAAPEKSEAAIVARAFRQLAHDEAADMPVWITELGFDENQGSPLKAIAIGNKTVLETQADWNLRSALLYAREGVEKAFFYQLYDDNPNSSIQFGSMGFLKPSPGRGRKPAADYFVQANKLIGNYTYAETLNADPIVDRYEQSGNSIYALMIPDEVGRTTTYNLQLPGVDSVKICRPQIGSDTLKLQYVRTSNGVLNIEVTETPLFVVPVSYSNNAANRSSNAISGLPAVEDSSMGTIVVAPAGTKNEVAIAVPSVLKKTPATDLQTAIHTQAVQKGMLKIDSKLVIYPNPATTTATIAFTADPDNETGIKVMDACTGKTVLHSKVGKGSSGVLRQIDISRFASGMYQVQLIQGKHQQQLSLIKVAQ